MNRLNFQRLFRGSGNSSQRFNNNTSNFSLPFDVTNNVNLYDHELNSNGRNSPNSDSISSPNRNNDNSLSEVRNNNSRTYPSPTQNNIRNTRNSRTLSVNENSLNNPYNSTNPTNSLDPNGLINEICIANMNNKCKFGNRCRFVHGTPCTLCRQNVYNPLKEMSTQVIGTVLFIYLEYIYIYLYHIISI